jgi:preprotein translocase subunit YajC
MPGQLVFFALLFGAMYVLMVRPQQQRARRQRELISSISVGDQVVTAGGMIGEVVDVRDDRVTVRLAPGVEVPFLRGAIAQKIADDTDDVVDLDGFDSLDEPADDAQPAAPIEPATPPPAPPAPPAPNDLPEEPPPAPGAGGWNP